MCHQQSRFPILVQNLQQKKMFACHSFQDSSSDAVGTINKQQLLENLE